MSKTIIFFGTDSFSAAALQALIDADYTIGAVITKPDSKSGRGQKLVAPLVKQIALEHNLTVWQPSKLSDIATDISTLGNPSQLVGVLSSYGRIVPQIIIDLFHPGIINIHPSLLPLYRGPSPIETAILNGDTRTGVSIMKLTAEMDAGPVYAQEIYPLKGTETAPELYATLSELGSRMVIETLPAIIEGSLLASPQQNTPIFSYLLKKDDALLQQDTMTALQAERQIRAFLAYPKTKLPYHDTQLIITKAHVLEQEKSDKDFVVAFRDETYLVIDELLGPSGKTMSGRDFKNGYAA